MLGAVVAIAADDRNSRGAPELVAHPTAPVVAVRRRRRVVRERAVRFMAFLFPPVPDGDFKGRASEGTP